MQLVAEAVWVLRVSERGGLISKTCTNYVVKVVLGVWISSLS